MVNAEVKGSSFNLSNLRFLHKTGTFQRFWNAASPTVALVKFTAPRAASGKLIEGFVAHIRWEEEMNRDEADEAPGLSG